MNHLPPDMAFGEDGALVGKTEFDFDALDADLFDPEAAKNLPVMTDAEIAAALQLFSELLAWVWQSGMKNVNGLMIRAAIVCWIFLKELRPLNLTEFAGGFGMDKQSFGRWVDDFKKQFPQIKTPHMRQAKPAPNGGNKSK